MCVARNQTQHLTLPSVFTSKWKANLSLIEWTEATVFLEREICFSEKIRQIPNLISLVHDVCNAMTFSRKVIIEQSHVDRYMLIETVIAENEKFVLKRIESVYEHDSYKFALFQKVPALGFSSEEPNKLDKGRAFVTYKSADWQWLRKCSR